VPEHASVILKVSDMSRTLEWYRAAGFAVRGHDEQPARSWAEVQRDGLVVQFLSGHTPWRESPQLSGCLYVHVPDVDRALTELRPPVRAPHGVEQRPWGAREILLTDPDGYHLALTED
jgi:hypothetical protein